jgi:DNA-binding CsgD family transcriptional regulator
MDSLLASNPANANLLNRSSNGTPFFGGQLPLRERLKAIAAQWYENQPPMPVPSLEEVIPNPQVRASIGMNAALQGPVVTFVYDFGNYKFAHISPSNAPFFKTYREALLSRGPIVLLEHMDADAAEQVYRTWESWSRKFLGLGAMEKYTFESNHAFPITTDAGKKLWFQMIVTPLHIDVNGNMVYALGYITEITPSKKDNAIDCRVSYSDGNGQRHTENLNEDEGPAVNMSDRQKEIVRLMLEGLNSKQISERLGISVHTVNNHRTRLKAKTGCKNAVHLTRYLLQQDAGLR